MTDNQLDTRQYWISQMEAGHRFMQSIMAYSVEENRDALCALRDVCKEATIEVEFSDSQIAPGLDRQFFLREGMIEGFVKVAREMNGQGWVLKVEDAYRSVPMQTALGLRQEIVNKVVAMIQWELGGKEPDLALIKRRLGVLVASCPKTGTHMSGSALDISVLNRDNGQEIDRGAPYLEMSEKTPMQSPFVDAQSHQNRMAITAIMEKHGFAAYPFEFWHYSSGDAIAELLRESGKPARYGAVDRDPQTGSIDPITDPLKPLNPDGTVMETIQIALKALQTVPGQE